MINTTSQVNAEKEAAFYEKDFKFSYSSMNTLLTAPAAFYSDYVLNNRVELHHKYLLEGTMIHFLVLENQGFDDNFILSSDNLPSPNNMLIADAMYKVALEKKDFDIHQAQLVDFSTEILEMLLEISLHQNLKDTKDGKGDDKRIAKITEPKTTSYFNFLKTRNGRTIIDSALLDKCTRRADVVKEDPEMRELLGMDLVSDGRTYGVYNELSIDMPLPNMPFGLKGILDNMVIDVKKKVVRINDFKTTGKSLTGFEISVEYWRYWLQGAVYKKLVEHYLKAILTDAWTIELRFIVFDTHNQLYAFLVTPETMVEWTERYENLLKEVEYHYTARDFQLPYAFAKKEVTL